jgi:ribonuclease HI
MRKSWDMPEESLFKYSGPDWLLVLLAGISNERRALVLLTLWRCWHMRNDAIHEKGQCSVGGSVNFLNRYLQELKLNCRTITNGKGKEPMFKQVNLSNANCSLAGRRPKAKQNATWTAPDSGWTKINVDASFDVNNGTCSIACLNRDHTGKVLWARNAAEIKCQDVPEAEARACLLELQSLQEAENAAVILESDSSVVVEAIKRRNQGHSHLWKLYEDIKTIQDSCLRFQAVKIGRESNKAAHLLADVARFSGQNGYWMGHVPPVVANIVESEAVKLVDSDI